ncbi:CDGSH iron-sulfur domain-containing protein [Micromonospora echinofusca]|uniref:CDGSH iron-sulfur domain-containing protein n=1 Tax=Micromonospora echinofusca TaxID=47858 RepID=A0ABS3W025_MICEH|nr:CDGSH iron-sulfur domain-containing protein [Micromonospora echinofusca]MBO4210125.1 CDGSH iron-sulfur domain-containing protein [Micromonospora echinofusca]
MPDLDQPAATVTTYEDGPLLLRGDFELRTQSGETIDARRRTVALCRCGGSAIKPFCDGTHKALDFRAASVPQRSETLLHPTQVGDPDPTRGSVSGERPPV